MLSTKFTALIEKYPNPNSISNGDIINIFNIYINEINSTESIIKKINSVQEILKQNDIYEIIKLTANTKGEYFRKLLLGTINRNSLDEISNCKKHENRAIAAKGYALIGEKQNVLDMLSDQSHIVRTAVIESLGYLGERGILFRLSKSEKEKGDRHNLAELAKNHYFSVSLGREITPEKFLNTNQFSARIDDSFEDLERFLIYKLDWWPSAFYGS